MSSSSASSSALCDISKSTLNKRIYLVAVDFSECSKFALEWCLSHLCLLDPMEMLPSTIDSNTSKLEIILLSIGSYSADIPLEMVDLETALLAELRKLWEMEVARLPYLKRLVDAGLLLVQFRVECASNVAECLERVTAEPQFSPVSTTLIVGNHGKTGHREMGSVSRHCMQNVSVPVVVVREPPLHARKSSLKHT